MPVPWGWDPSAALATRPAQPRSGAAWRLHRRHFAPLDPTGSLLFSGRYHRGRDRFPLHRTWAALYLALSAEVCLAEVLRHLTPDRLPLLNDYRLSEVAVDLAAVLDCRDAASLGLAATDLWHDTDFSVTQALGAAAVALGAEGVLVLSATRLGDGLIVFPPNLRATSALRVVSWRDPRLYVPRP